MDITKPCYLFFDYDETVYHEQEIPREIKESLEKLRQMGHHIYLNTGRSYGNLRKNAKYADVPWDGLICGGADIVIGGEHILRSSMDTEQDAVPWLKYCMNHCYTLNYGGQEHFKQYAFHQLEAVPTEEEQQAYLADLLEFSKGNPATKLSVFSKTVALELCDAPVTPGLELVYIHPKGIELFQKGKQKGSAIRALCDYLGVDISQCACFGDSMNDLDMFCACETSVAMQRSPEELVKHASYHATGAGYGVIEGLQVLFGTLFEQPLTAQNEKA